ncbi:hypothetical protein [Bradyrhizobium sp. AUGA SZCCT0431]|uniref:hypothetical protein n=1 Tax=Bradyrhizobium sp. AUGA SZCCT0431 TaxID=2807674 RepID=UPI001BA91865|nr:hypothetical protein [Bradyrhizobium sp. AUGA SZCCT0431]MBR1142375.1 hypothetical protein [Bradyrhizobium sp. AUGA SZCCT0431]
MQAYKNAQETPANLGLDQPVKNVLVIIPGYAAATSRIGEGSALLSAVGSLWRILTTGNYKSFVQQYRDYYANPRSSAYMAEAVGELIGKALPDAQVVLACPAQDDCPSSWAARRLPLAPAPADYSDLVKSLGTGVTFDAAILAHHDALGLGLYPLERALLAQFKDVFVINGRRRVYRLDQPAQQAHKLRRFLAQTRSAELLMSYRIDLLTFFLKWSNQPRKS